MNVFANENVVYMNVIFIGDNWVWNRKIEVLANSNNLIICDAKK